MSADVFNGTEELATTVIGFRTQKGIAAGQPDRDLRKCRRRRYRRAIPGAGVSGRAGCADFGRACAPAIDTRGELDGLAGTLEVGQGALQPTPDTRPIPFDGARAYVAYDPADQTLRVHPGHAEKRGRARSPPRGAPICRISAPAGPRRWSDNSRLTRRAAATRRDVRRADAVLPRARSISGCGWTRFRSRSASLRCRTDERRFLCVRSGHGRRGRMGRGA